MRTINLILFLLMHIVLKAQQTPLMVQLDDQQKPFLNHKIGLKENFYSIGRIYNISPRVYAPYNGMDLTAGLTVGNVLRIPLNETNFWQTGSRKSNETVIPVYHQVKAKETITSVGKLYNIDKSSLISWNNLSGEKINEGDKIIIGFLKVDKSLSPLAAQGAGPRAEPPSPITKEPKVVNPDSAKTKKTTPDPKVIKNKQEPVKEEQKTESNPVQQVVKTTEEIAATYSGSGFFIEEYNTQTGDGKRTQSSRLTGGSFKSTSGWTDGKFYILVDNIEKGTIVQLYNQANKKKVYAKVLASISETKPGAVEAFLISNATESQLGLKGNNYELELSWEK